MFDALQIAATGMQAQQTHVDAIANNLANVNTPGYKRARVAFFDLVTQGSAVAAPPGLDDAGVAARASRGGAGVAVAAVGKLFDAGDLRKTDAAMDVAIAGDGFLEVSMPDGSRAYTRGGSLKIGADGTLAVQSGHALKPGIAVPENTVSLTIAGDGKVHATTTTSRGTPTEIGQLQMARFMSPATLTALGDGLYRASDASGEPIGGRAGEDAMGAIRQGYLEGSNVKLVDEMVNLMVAQRAYEASVKVVQASDEMLGMVNNLRR